MGQFEEQFTKNKQQNSLKIHVKTEIRFCSLSETKKKSNMRNEELLKQNKKKTAQFDPNIFVFKICCIDTN